MSRIEVQNAATEVPRDAQKVTKEDIKRQEALRSYRQALAERNASFVERTALPSSTAKAPTSLAPLTAAGQQPAAAGFAALSELLLSAPPSTAVSARFAFTPSAQALTTPFSPGFSKALTLAAFAIAKVDADTPLTLALSATATAAMGQAASAPESTLQQMMAAGMDVEQLVEVVMLASAKDVTKDLRDMATKMQSINADKVAQRALKRAYRDMHTALEGKMRQEFDALKSKGKLGDGWTFEDYASWRQVAVSPPDSRGVPHARVAEPSPPEIPTHMGTSKTPKVDTKSPDAFGLSTKETAALKAYFRTVWDRATPDFDAAFSDWLQDDVGLDMSPDGAEAQKKNQDRLQTWLDEKTLDPKAGRNGNVQLSTSASPQLAQVAIAPKAKPTKKTPLQDLRVALNEAKTAPAAKPPSAAPSEGVAGSKAPAAQELPRDMAGAELMSLAQMQGLEEEADDHLQNTSDMGELEMVKLQALMDRRSKLLETLSNIMAKTSNTAAQITKNMGG